MKNIFSQINRINTVNFVPGEPFKIVLPGTQKTEDKNILCESTECNKMLVGKSYRITVKKYMTEPATPQFDFQIKWNNGIPMPMCVMSGKVLKETRGMIYMELTGKAEMSCNCFVCGKTLTNPISKLYGVGPECSEKIGLIRISNEMEVKDRWEEIDSHLIDIKWTGWVIRSAIKNWEEI